MAYLNRKDILNAQDRVFEDVEVPEWGGIVRVSTISGADRDAFEADALRIKGRVTLINVRARLVAMACVDEDGNKLFNNEDAADLGRKSAAALDRVFNIAMKLAGLRPADIEEISENFTEGQNGNFTLS